MPMPVWLTERRQATAELTGIKGEILNKVDEMVRSELAPPMLKAAFPAFRLTFSSKLASFSDDMIRQYVREFRDWLNEILGENESPARKR